MVDNPVGLVSILTICLVVVFLPQVTNSAAFAAVAGSSRNQHGQRSASHDHHHNHEHGKDDCAACATCGNCGQSPARWENGNDLQKSRFAPSSHATRMSRSRSSTRGYVLVLETLNFEFSKLLFK